jgi:iron complex transport system substrate-binding protein
MTKLEVEPVALPKGSLPAYLDKYKDDKYVVRFIKRHLI